LAASIKVGIAAVAGLGLALLIIMPLAAAGPVISVRGSAASASPGQTATLRLELLNHTDQIRYNGQLTVTLPAGFSYVPGSARITGEGWPINTADPISSGQTLGWGPHNLPAAGITAHNLFGIHTMMDSCSTAPALHLEGAKTLIGSGGYVTQLFYPVITTTTGPSQCAINFVQEAYARNLIPILRLEGMRVGNIWQAPDPGPNNDYAEIAQAYARFVAGLPRRSANPLYIVVWNEPNLWIEWSSAPNAAQYARFFVAVSTAIRGLGDARIRLVNGALAPADQHLSFLDKMLRVAGFSNAFDVWASHCYPYNHPAWYNSHTGKARYGTYAIDCYLEEQNVIKKYGRTGFKFILTETGYQLGEDTYNFEGFSTITENNRADYMASAFRDYWPNWPEVIAATPFELSDPAGWWDKYDWISPTSPFTPHLQYSRVAALPKPAGQVEPYGYQVTFRVNIDPAVAPGTYTLQLSGSDAGGNVAAASEVITVTQAVSQTSTYLPAISKSPGTSGPWYMETAANTDTAGAIIPTAFLTPAIGAQTAAENISVLPLASPPLALALDSAAGLGAVLQQNGLVDAVDLAAFALQPPIFVGQNPRLIALGAPGSGQFFVALDAGVVKIDLPAGQVGAITPIKGRITGLVWDDARQRLLLADAANERLLALASQPLQPVATAPLGEQPGQLLLDAAANRLFALLPGAGQVIALDAATLTPIARANVTGGPLLAAALAPAQNRLVVLNALTPRLRMLTVFDTQLNRQALIAGSELVPLQTATAVAATPAGSLLVAEASQVWQVIWPGLAAQPIAPVSAGDVAVNPQTGAIYLLDAVRPVLVRISP